MSQAKVDRYKEQKTNRKKIMAQEKRKHIAAVVCGWIAAAAIVCWAGYSAYNIYENSRPIETVYVNLDPLNDYMNTLYSGE